MKTAVQTKRVSPRKEKLQWGRVSSPCCWTNQPGSNQHICFHSPGCLLGTYFAWSSHGTCFFLFSVWFGDIGRHWWVPGRKQRGGWSRFRDMVRSVANEGRALREKRRLIWDEQGFSHSAAHKMNLFVFKIYPQLFKTVYKKNIIFNKWQESSNKENVNCPASTRPRRALGGKKEMRSLMMIITCFVEKKPPLTLYFWQQPGAPHLC